MATKSIWEDADGGKLTVTWFKDNVAVIIVTNERTLSEAAFVADYEALTTLAHMFTTLLSAPKDA